MRRVFYPSPLTVLTPRTHFYIPALGGDGLPMPAIAGPGAHTSYFLLATPGGRMPLQAVLTNGAVILEHGQFVERRVSLGPVRILTPHGSPSL